MALELKQQQRLSQQLVMTPQLQQAIKLLQLSRLELVDLVQHELEENPVLEEGPELDGPEETGVGERTDEVARGDESEFEAPVGEGERSLVASERAAEPSDAEKIADIDWQEYLENRPQTGIREARDESERPSFEATLTRRATLAEHLLWQLRMDAIDPAEQVAAEFIIGNLDERGYLQSSLEEIARQAGLQLPVVERALQRVQALDPTGVGARDLRECLRIQLLALGIRQGLAVRVVEEELEALINRDFRGLARRLGATVEEIAQVAELVRGLEPRPGRDFGGVDPVYIIPDIYVHKIGDEFHVVLNDDGLPRLRISRLYQQVLARGSDSSKDTRAYVNDKVRSAMWLIKSIQQRQRTIYRVMQSIIRFQREFFERGINYLKPLNLRDVADDIQMHESTVSRVTTNKYAHTPQGIFELKYFFNSSINRLDGDSIASESVKERILALIRNEDPKRPFSDQRIAELLRSHNIDIARRTVTKYREALNLLSSSKRRQVR